LTVRAADLNDAVTVLRTVKAWFMVRDNPSLPAQAPAPRTRRFADDA
jgi:hypothetical protein